MYTYIHTYIHNATLNSIQYNKSTNSLVYTCNDYTEKLYNNISKYYYIIILFIYYYIIKIAVPKNDTCKCQEMH